MATQQESYGQVANYNISPGTRSDQQSSALEVDNKGNLLVNLNAGNPAVTLGSVQITDNTNSANILKSDGTAAGQNAQIVAGTFLEKSGSAASLNADIVASFDVSNYRSGSLQLTGSWNGAVSVQGSNDNSNFVTVQISSADNGNLPTPVADTTGSNGIYRFPINFRYLRIRATSYSSGTIVGTLELYTYSQNVWPTSSFGFDGNFIRGFGVEAANYLSSGSNSFDMQKNNYNTTTGDTPTITSATTTNGATQTNYNARGAIITVILGTVTGVSPSLSIQLQWSPDGGTTWLTYGPASTTLASATGQSLAIICYPTVLPNNLLGTTTTGDDAEINAPLPRTWRLTFISTGTITSIAVSSVQVNYML